MPAVSSMLKGLTQGALMVALAAGLALGVNALRSDGLPVMGQWSPEVRLQEELGLGSVISLEEAAQLFSENKALFLDARGSRDYGEGHILGARNLPWQSFEETVDQVMGDVSRDTPLISYCDGEDCTLSEELVRALIAMGYQQVRVLVNGWTRWVAEGLPTAREVGEQR